MVGVSGCCDKFVNFNCFVKDLFFCIFEGCVNLLIDFCIFIGFICNMFFIFFFFVFVWICKLLYVIVISLILRIYLEIFEYLIILLFFSYLNENLEF